MLSRIPLSRRSLVQHAGLGALSFGAGGATMLLTPENARAQQLPFSVLNAAEVAILEALGETLLPGAAKAGLAHYVDQQIGGHSDDCLLIARYMGVTAPYRDFYKSALAAVDRAAVQTSGKGLVALSAADRTALVKQMLAGKVEGWAGAHPQFLTYFILRNDAIDVVYGTMEGFDKLNIPYMAHIEPSRKW